MPIEIKELQITVEVSPQLTGSGQPLAQGGEKKVQKEIVKIAAEKVLNILKSKKER
ncbi:MAG: DUF5908 family protein [Niabella sp.]